MVEEGGASVTEADEFSSIGFGVRGVGGPSVFDCGCSPFIVVAFAATAGSAPPAVEFVAATIGRVVPTLVVVVTAEPANVGDVVFAAMVFAAVLFAAVVVVVEAAAVVVVVGVVLPLTIVPTGAAAVPGVAVVCPGTAAVSAPIGPLVCMPVDARAVPLFSASTDA